MMLTLQLISIICSIIALVANGILFKKSTKLLTENKTMKKQLEDQFYLQGVAEVRKELPTHKDDTALATFDDWRNEPREVMGCPECRPDNPCVNHND